MSEDIRALKFEGGVDADGHILEDKNLWENYLEAKYKPKAIRLKKDRTGLEYMEIEGRPSKFLSGGMFAGLSAMGNTREMGRNSADYGGMAPFGAMDPTERLKRIETIEPISNPASACFQQHQLELRKFVEGAVLIEARERMPNRIRRDHVVEEELPAKIAPVVAPRHRPHRLQRRMNPKRNAEFLRFREYDVMIRMRMRLARHHELGNPSTLASVLDRALQLLRGSLRIS